MNKLILCLFVFLLSCNSFSQEIVNESPIKLKKNRDVFQIVDNNSKITTLFVSDKESVKIVQLDEKMQVLDSLSTPRPEKNFTSMLGYNGNSKNPRLFWSSSNNKEIFTQSYDFKATKIESKNYSLALKDEVYLETFSDTEKFYILTIIKNSNNLKLYIFNNNGEMNEKTLDLSGCKFFSSQYKKTDLYGLFAEGFFTFERPFSIQKISTESPTALSETSMKRKCYFYNHSIILAFDTNNAFSQLITINLDNYSINDEIIKMPFIQYDNPNFISSNSFLLGTKLYQIKSSPAEFAFVIYDLTNKAKKEFWVDKDSKIDFKNSDIQQIVNKTDNKRILENTSQFVRKLNNLHPAIAGYRLNDEYLITIGSVTEERSNDAAIIGGMFGAAGAIIAAAIANPTMDNFNAYANRKVVFINCLFDKEDNHINGSIQPLAFDKIRDFCDQNLDISSKTLFKLDKLYYFGYYNDDSKKYIIRKFTD